MKRRVALYARVSSETQAREGVSLENQEAMARDYCTRYGYEYVSSFVDVASGRKDARPSLDRLMEEAKAGRFDVVAVYRLDRLGRSLVKTLQVVGELGDLGVQVASMTQPFQIDGSMGKLLIAIYASFAEMESEAIGARIRDARRHRVLTQGRHYAVPPVGYKRETKGGPLLLDEATAPHIVWAYQQAAQGVPLGQVVSALNTRCRTATGGAWTHAGLRVVLMNPVYKGQITHGRKSQRRTSKGEIKRTIEEEYTLADAEHEPLIDEVTWQSVQLVYEGRRKGPNRTGAAESRHPWLAVGRCGHCGARLQALKGGHGRPHIQYRCSRIMRAHAEKCGMGGVSERILTALVLRAVAPMLDPSYKRRTRPKAKRPQVDRTKEIARIEAAIRREGDLYRIGAQDLATTEGRVKELRRELSKFADPEEAPMTERLIIADLLALWRNLTASQRAVLLRRLFVAVRVERDRLVIEWSPELADHMGGPLEVPRPRNLRGPALEAIAIE